MLKIHAYLNGQPFQVPNTIFVVVVVMVMMRDKYKESEG
jgi:hypothetical protein